jgi:hypothetical protein
MYTLNKIVYKRIPLASRIMRVGAWARTHVRVRRMHSKCTKVGNCGTKWGLVVGD